MTYILGEKKSKEYLKRKKKNTRSGYSFFSSLAILTLDKYQSVWHP